MAFTVTEEHFVNLGGQVPGLCMLIGIAVNTAGDSGGDILPGNETVGTSLAAARGLRKIYFCSAISATDENAVEAVIDYDTTQDGDKVTIDCTADETIKFMIIGENAGQ